MSDTKLEFLRRLLGSPNLPGHLSGLDESILYELGKHLKNTPRSLWGTETGEKELVSIEGIVNDWFVIASDLKPGGELPAKLQEAADILGEVVDRIQKEPGLPRNSIHFSKIREAGLRLQEASILLD